MTHVTCRLIAKNRDQLGNPTLGYRVWAAFTAVCRSASRSARTLVSQHAGAGGGGATPGQPASSDPGSTGTDPADPPWYRTFPPFTAAAGGRSSGAASSWRSLPAMAVLPPLAPALAAASAKKHANDAYGRYGEYLDSKAVSDISHDTSSNYLTA